MFRHHIKTASIALSLLLLASCGGDEEKKVEQKPIQSIIFIDKSTSVLSDPEYVTRKYSKALQSVVNNNIRTKGDRMDIYYIHENTSKAQAYSDVCKAAVLEDTVNASPNDKEAIKNDFELALRKEKSDFLNQALAQLLKQNETATNQQTDIWASLEVIDRIAESNAEIDVYYLSDMVESMPGEKRRDFHEAPPQSREQAEEWAKADAATLQKMIKPELAGRVNINFVLPFKPTSSTKENNPNVTYYWEKVFELVGVKNPVKEIN